MAIKITDVTQQASAATGFVLGVLGGAARLMPFSTLGAAVSWIQNGTGAKQRPVQDKFREYVDMTDYYDSAIDGSDYSPALTRALAANSAVRIPAGSWTFNTIVDVPNNSRIRGVGSVFSDDVGGSKCLANAGFLRNPTTTRRRWEIYGLSIKGNMTASTKGIQGPHGGIIRECRFENYPVGIENASSFLTDYDRCCFAGTGTYGISLADSNGVSITRCFFDATWKTHITTRQVTPLTGSDNGSPMILARNNHNASSNQYTNMSLVEISGNVVMQGCYFEDFSPTGVPSGCKFVDVKVNGFGDFGLTIINNEMNGSAEATNAIYLNGTRTGTLPNDCGGLIMGNRFLGFDNASRPAIAFGANNCVPMLVIRDNMPRDHSITGRHNRSIYKPLAHTTWTTSQSITSASTWTDMDLDATLIVDNSDATVTTANAFRCRRPGYYRFSAVIKAQSTASSYPNIEARLTKGGTQVGEITSQALSFISNPTNVSLRIDQIVLCAVDDDIKIQARNGQNTVGGVFTAEFLSVDGHG